MICCPRSFLTIKSATTRSLAIRAAIYRGYGKRTRCLDFHVRARKMAPMPSHRGLVARPSRPIEMGRREPRALNAGVRRALTSSACEAQSVTKSGLVPILHFSTWLVCGKPELLICVSRISPTTSACYPRCRDQSDCLVRLGLCRNARASSA